MFPGAPMPPATRGQDGRRSGAGGGSPSVETTCQNVRAALRHNPVSSPRRRSSPRRARAAERQQAEPTAGAGFPEAIAASRPALAERRSEHVRGVEPGIVGGGAWECPHRGQETAWAVAAAAEGSGRSRPTRARPSHLRLVQDAQADASARRTARRSGPPHSTTQWTANADRTLNRTRGRSPKRTVAITSHSTSAKPSRRCGHRRRDTGRSRRRTGPGRASGPPQWQSADIRGAGRSGRARPRPGSGQKCECLSLGSTNPIPKKGNSLRVLKGTRRDTPRASRRSELTHAEGGSSLKNGRIMIS